MPFSSHAVLLPCHGLEDFPSHLTGIDAENLLTHWTAMWHPVLINATGKAPGWISCDFVDEQTLTDSSKDLPGLLFVPQICHGRVPDVIQNSAASGAAVLIENLDDREQLLSVDQLKDLSENEPRIPLLQDFFALGYAFLQIQLMTRQLRYSSSIEMDEFEKRLVNAARSAVHGEDDVKENITACFDLLLEEKTRYYPTQPLLIDLVLLAETTIGNSLSRQLDSTHVQNILAAGNVLERISEKRPDNLKSLQSAVEDERLSLFESMFHEVPSQLVTLESILRQIQLGLQSQNRLSLKRLHDDLEYAQNMFARFKFGLSPQLPGLLSQLNISGVLHTCFSGEEIPTGSSSTINWQGIDHSMLLALTETPINAASSDDFLNLGVKIGEDLDSAHTSTKILAHWPDQTCSSFDDLVTLQKYGAPLGNFVSIDELMDNIYDPGYSESYSADEYKSSALDELCQNEVANPVSMFIEYWRLSSFLLGARNAVTILSICAAGEDGDNSADIHARLAGLERELDYRIATNQTADHLLPEVEKILGELTLRSRQTHEIAHEESTHLLNPVSFPRRLLGKEFSAFSVSEFTPATIEEKSKTFVDELNLVNDHLSVSIDPETGGIQSVNRHGSRGNYLSQQIALRHTVSTKKSGSPLLQARYSKMVVTEISSNQISDYEVEVVSRGKLEDQDKTVADFTQRIQLRHGVAVVEIEIEINPVSPPIGNPWNNYYCSRLAWKNESALLQRSENEIRHDILEDRLVAPNYVDIIDGEQKVTVLPFGAPFHRRASRRILDTLLIVAGETKKKFRLGVGIDLDSSIRTATDCLTPYFELFDQQSSASSNRNQLPNGWIFHLNCKNVIATFTQPKYDDQNQLTGVVFRLLETEGRAGELVISCPHEVTRAAQLNFLGHHMMDLGVDGKTTSIGFTPFQFFQIEICWNS